MCIFPSISQSNAQYSMETEKYICFLCGKEHKSDDYCSITHKISEKHEFHTHLIGGVTRTTTTESIEVKICKACFWKRFCLRVFISYLLVALIAVIINIWDSTLNEQIKFACDNFDLILFVGTIFAFAVNMWIVSPFLGKFILLLRKTNEDEAYENNAIIPQHENPAPTTRDKHLKYIEYILLFIFNIGILYFFIFKRKGGDFFDLIFCIAILNVILIFLWNVIIALLRGVGLLK